ncbi:MAG TPA: response regulator transcription factor [Thermoanaerobaculia bacterium]
MPRTMRSYARASARFSRSLRASRSWGEASNGREALEILEEFSPDILLLDISMPGMNGLEAASRAARVAPGTRVILVSMHANEEYVQQALQAGAAGYVLKDAGMAELELAIRSVARGETFLSPAVSRSVIADYVSRIGPKKNPLDALTPRQREVLQLVAEGKTTKRIAQELKVAVKTVETHRAQLMARLDIHDLAGLVRFAVRVGLVASGR